MAGSEHSLVKSKAVNASEIASWLIDMDGVLVREEHPIEGANRFLDLLRKNDTPFLVLTNNSMFTRRSRPRVFSPPSDPRARPT